jgi:hypothetical protein
MRLIQDDDAVLLELVVQQALTQQHAVSHILDVRLWAGAVLETDGITNLHGTHTGNTVNTWHPYRLITMIVDGCCVLPAFTPLGHRR